MTFCVVHSLARYDHRGVGPHHGAAFPCDQLQRQVSVDVHVQGQPHGPIQSLAQGHASVAVQAPVRSPLVPLRPLSALPAVQGMVCACGLSYRQVQVHVHAQVQHHGPFQYLAQKHSSSSTSVHAFGVRLSACLAGTLSCVLGGFA